MEHNETEVRQLLGKVKWFDPVKGFGFVVADEGGPDILLHANVLRNFGQSSVADAAGVQIRIQKTARGVQATEVLSIAPPETDSFTELEDEEFLNLVGMDETPLEPARVKWFDKAKGFGFANIFGNNDDVFIHIEVLRRSGLSDLQSGEAIGLRLVDGERGRMAIEVVGWEVAAK